MEERIRLAHGNGGRYSHELMEQLILPRFTNPFLKPLHDGAQVDLPKGTIAFTTDSYVVTPHFFPGGNIGKLAVCGTVNDLTMNGAVPKYLTCSLILEEGLPFKTLDAILATMAESAEEAGIQIVTGDTKVVEKGAVDGIYINTAGIGHIRKSVDINATRIRPHMDIILTGSLGDHAVAVMGARYGLSLPDTITTDCAPLNHMIGEVLEVVPRDVVMLRDPTRGGLGTALTEIAAQGQVGIRIDEEALCIHDEVASVCALLGYDPLYLANEGKAVLVVKSEATEQVLSLLRRHEYGREAAKIGETVEGNVGKVALRTVLGGIRLLDALGDDQVPRIC